MRGKKLLQSMLSFFLAGTAFAADPVTASAESVEFSLYHVSDQTVYADEYGSAVLEAGIDVWGEGSVEDVHLQWYEVDEQNDSEYILEDCSETVLNLYDISGYSCYRCIGSDDAGNTDSIDFYVYPWDGPEESGFSLDSVSSSYLEADKNGEASLEVAVNVWGNLKETDISLQWYEFDEYEGTEQLLSGETSKVLHITGITEYRYFRCTGTDPEGNTSDTEFTVYPYDPDFELYTASDSTVRADQNGNAELKAGVNVWGGVNEDDISLQWYKLNPYYDEDTGVLLNGETSAVLQLTNVAEYSKYRCVGTDPDGFTKEVDFYVYPWSSSGESISFEMQHYSNEDVKADQDGTAVLEVYIYVYDDTHSEDDISLQWYELIDGKAVPLSGENSKKLVVNNVDRKREFICVGTDNVSTTRSVSFHVYPWSRFEVTADGDTERIITPGASETLHVNVESDLPVNYSWYAGYVADDLSNGFYKDYDDFDNDSDTLVLENITKSQVVTVRVSTEAGDSKYITFDIVIENHLTVKDKSLAYAEPGKEKDIHIIYAADDTEDMQFIWYAAENGDYWDREFLADAHGSDLTVGPVETGQFYTFYVIDKYKNYREGEIEVQIDNGFSVLPVGDTEKYLNPGDDVDLAVQVNGKDLSSVTYEWELEWSASKGYVYEVIEGADSDTYSIPDFNEAADIECTVTDKYGNSDSVTYYLRIDNGFKAYAEQETVYVDYGSPAELHVIAEGKDLSKASYQWYLSENYDLIELDNTTDTLVIDEVTEYENYRCIVKDGFGNEEDIYFTVSVQNHLKVGKVHYNYEVEPGTDLTMEVFATADDTSDMTYLWQLSKKDGLKTVQEGELSTYTLKDIREKCDVRCYVTDKYGNTERVYFEIGIKPDFTAVPEKREYRVLPGEETTLKILVSSETADLSKLTYRWHGYSNGKYWTSEDILGDAGTSYTKVFDYTGSVYCDVSAPNGAEEIVYFNVVIENHLSVKAEKTSFSVDPGEDVTMEVIVNADDMTGMTCQWYKEIEDDNGNYEREPVEGGTSQQYTIHNAKENGSYVFTVEDRFGTFEEVYFNIHVVPQFTAWAEKREFVIHSEEEVTMRVLTASDVEDTSLLTYQWYEVIMEEEDYGTTFRREEISGETGAELTGTYSTSKDILCVVKSPRGGERSVSFAVIRENHFSVTAEQEEFSVEKGDDITLSVITTADDLTGITYHWRQAELQDGRYYMTIRSEETTEPSFKAVNVQGFTDVTCTATDRYGNTARVYFAVSLKTHFTAAAEKELFTVKPGEEVTFKVLSSSDEIDISQLRYEWTVTDNSNGSYHETVLDETGSSVTRAFYTASDVICRVTAPDGSYIIIYFTVEIENHLTAEAAVNPVRVKKGETAAVRINVTADDTSGMEYWWDISNESSISQTSVPEITIPNVQEDLTVFCRVTDKYKNERVVKIKVEVYDGDISLDQTEVDLVKGESITLKAESNTAVTWSSSDANIAAVDQNGKVTGKAVGDAVITATNADGESARCIVHVYAKVTAVKLDKFAATVKKGDSLQLTATVIPEDARDKSVKWSSSDASVATVDTNGKVTGVKGGIVKITVKTNDGGFTAECTVKVLTPAESVTLDQTELALKKGESQTLTATVLPAEADNKEVTWSSSDETVAEVDANGKVTAVKSGTAVITATTNDGGYTAECAVTVTTPVTGVTLNKKSISLEIGAEEIMTASVTPEDADDKTVAWASSDESIAEVDAGGKVTAVSAGTAVITVTTTDGNYTAECTVTVREPGSTISVAGVELNKTELTLRVGKSETLTATVLPEDAEDKSVTWSSSDTAVAEVDQNGNVTAVADTGIAEPSSAVITATTNDGSYMAECKVNVEDPINGFVRRLYKLCFSRNADAGGFNKWTTELRTKKNTAAATVKFFFSSTEFKNLQLNNEDFVEMCYAVLMGRKSDAGGKNGWVTRLEAGMSETYVLRGFVGSREFTNICSDYGVERGNITTSEPRDKNQGITEFVSRCYSEVLGRKADTGGLNTWCKKILDASDKKKAAINMASTGFFHSREYLSKNTTNDEYVKTLYRTFLGREADTGGYNGWMEKLDSGTSRDSVLKGFANSTEFANIMAKYGIK